MNEPMPALPVTPVHVKAADTDDFPADDERVCYVVSSDGLFIGRRTEVGPGAWFRSMVPAPRPPAELAGQEPSLALQYPMIPSEFVQQVVSFFRQVAWRDGGEAIVLLTMDRGDGRLDLLVPQQHATVGELSHGRTYPIDLRYELDEPVPPGCCVIGDIHSHVFESAYASSLDTADELHAPGLHIVVGHVDRARPSWWADFVVDGFRFGLTPGRVLELPDEPVPDVSVPAAWMDRVETTVRRSRYAADRNASWTDDRHWTSPNGEDRR